MSSQVNQLAAFAGHTEPATALLQGKFPGNGLPAPVRGYILVTSNRWNSDDCKSVNP